MKRFHYPPILFFNLWGLFLLTTQAQVSWTGGSWDQGSSWSTGFVPSGLVTGLEVISTDANDTLLAYKPLATSQSWYAHVINMVIDGRSTGNLTVLQERDPLGFDATLAPFNLGPSEFSATNLYIGHTGWGTYDLSGGILRIGSTLKIGSEGLPQAGDPDAFGLLKISGTSELIADPNGNGEIWEVGAGHDGKIQQSGGHVQALYGFNGAGDTQFVGQSRYILVMGRTGNAQTTSVTGTYELSGGILDINEIRLGWAGHGEFEQTGGTVNVGKLFVGHSVTGSTGQYLFNGGVLNSTFHPQGVVVGGAGATGVFTHQAGTHTSSSVSVADGGEYILTGGSLNSHVGVATEGIYNQEGGTQTGSKNIAGRLLLSGGTSSGYFQLNEGGLVTHTGGTNNTFATDLPSLNIQGGNYLLQDTGIFTSANEALIGSTGTGTFTQSGGQSIFSDNVIIGEQAGSDGTFNFTGGTASLGNITIGKQGTGMFSQSQTTLTGVGSILLGTEPTGDGFWFSTFDAQLSASSTDIGVEGTGFMHLIDGDTVLSGPATLGTNAGGSGTLEIEAGSTFSSNGLSVGVRGVGQVDLDGGSLTVTNALTVGDITGGAGNVIQDAGTFSSASSVIGVAGLGFYTQNAGSHQTSYLTLGVGSGGEGTYHYLDGSLDISDSLLVGVFGTGTFNHGSSGQPSGPSLSLTQDLVLGQQADSSGSYLLEAGSLSAPNLIVGQSGAGSLVQNGGQVTLSDEQAGGGHTSVGLSGTGYYTQNAGIHQVGTLALGIHSDGTGEYQLNDGVLDITDDLVVGDSGTGLFIQAGGSAAVADTFVLGRNSGSSGEAHFDGGVFQAGGIQVGGLLDVDGGTVVSGGSTTVANSPFTKLRITSGSLTTDSLTVANATNGLDLQGGTLTVNSDTRIGIFSVDILGPLNLNAPATVTIKGIFDIGQFGDVSLNHTGARLDVERLNLQSGASLNLSSGELRAGTLDLLDDFSATGGTVNVSGDLLLSSSGMTLWLLGDAQANIAGNLDIGYAYNTGSSTVRVQETAGLEVDGRLLLGGNPFADNFLSIRDSATVTADSALIGNFGTGWVRLESGTLNVTDTLELSHFSGASSRLDLQGGQATFGDAVVGHEGVAVVNQSGGTATFESQILGVNPSGRGTYNLSGGTLSNADVVVGEFGSGIFSQTGGSHIVSGTLTIEKNATASGSYELSGDFSGPQLHADTIENNGSFTMSGATRLSAQTLNNNGTFSYTGAGLYVTSLYEAETAFSSVVKNKGTFEIFGFGFTDVVLNGKFFNDGTASVNDVHLRQTGNFRNNGELYINNSHASFEEFVSSGAVVVDPSIVSFTDAFFEETGYLVATGEDIIYINGDFTNLSQQATLWDTDESLLRFTPGLHSWSVAGADLGADLLGYEDNFAWGTVELMAGGSLKLIGGAGEAAYVKELRLGDGLTQLDEITGSAFLYYDGSNPANDYLGLNEYALLGGGRIAPAAVPEPSITALIGGALALALALSRRRRSS